MTDHPSRPSPTPQPDKEIPLLPEQTFLPDVYHLPEGKERTSTAELLPRCVFVEVTNCCNLRCETCPRTYTDRETPKTLSFDEFVYIVDQFPDMQRAVLHGIGEPLLNQELPQMIRYLKTRGVNVLFNSNGSLLTGERQAALVNSELDEFRCSIDGATAKTYARIRGVDVLDKVKQGLAGLVKTKARLKAPYPRISIWCVATKLTLPELPDLIRLAGELGVPEVYLQRMTYFAQTPTKQYGMATHEQAIFGQAYQKQEAIIAECEALATKLGIDFRASGARDPRNSFAAARGVEVKPWQACLRAWTTAYITASGNCLPCCISPFATHDYPSLILGNLFEKPFAEIWNGIPYRQFRADFLSDHPHPACAGCGVFWSI